MDFPLWDKAAAVQQRALQSQSLQSLQTRSDFITDQGLTFQIRQLSNLRDKQHTAPANHSGNPFLPHEEALYISTVGPRHKLLLNKFNVLDQHLLLVTQDFEAQQRVLNLDDFRALQRCMQQADCLAFYNNGPTAGASQTHKHLQLIRMPAEPCELIPFQPQLQQFNDQVPRKLDALPFCHAGLALPAELFDPEYTPAEDAAVQLHNLYDRLRMTLEIEAINDEISQPYNLLLTREWMLLVPRTQEAIDNLSLNALAFVGSILVRDSEQAQRVKQRGPARMLATVSGG
ncbi:DUF4922 domain-containing protein [Neptuniibacter halophilus]|uniref:DUF4922 domain-containing protein n=1 Tax=Neptuniibacter halophilus TaxID=651666 RepID=UPI002572A2C0|nr:DUF4922 domain-containing protein [Neptuniibacter halophilus]